MPRFMHCTLGCRHFGEYGGAGLIIYRYRQTGEVEVLLGRRSSDTHDGLTWSTIGGAMEKGELITETVVREASEEIGIDITDILEPTAISVTDHGNWSYSTIFATPKAPFSEANLKLDENEVTEVAWFTRADLSAASDLHPGIEEMVKTWFDFVLPPDFDPATGNIINTSPLSS